MTVSDLRILLEKRGVLLDISLSLRFIHWFELIRYLPYHCIVSPFFVSLLLLFVTVIDDRLLERSRSS
jgi:hypothetical protein